jgi:hypothetical protein
MGRRSKEFHAFDSLTKQLLAVPKSTIHERHAAHKKKAALNPKKRGPKPKIKPPSGGHDEA